LKGPPMKFEAAIKNTDEIIISKVFDMKRLSLLFIVFLAWGVSLSADDTSKINSVPVRAPSEGKPTLEQIQGDWLNKRFMEALVQSRSPNKSYIDEGTGYTAFFIKKIDSLLFRWDQAWGFHEGAFLRIKGLESTTELNTYRILYDNYQTHGGITDNDHFIIENSLPVKEITWTFVDRYDSKKERKIDFVRVEPSLDEFVNRVVIAGTYKDIDGCIFTFKESGEAIWPGKSFKYTIGLDRFWSNGKFDELYIIGEKIDNIYPMRYAFERKDNLLLIYKIKNVNSDTTVEREEKPLFILAPLRNEIYDQINLNSSSSIQTNQQNPIIISYQIYLKTLDIADRKSIPAARDEFFKRFSKTPAGTTAEGFRVFRSFYKNVVFRCDRKYFSPPGSDTIYKGAYFRKDYQNILNDIMSLDSHTAVVTDDLLNKDPMEVMNEKGTDFISALKKKYNGAIDELLDFRKCGMKFSWGEGDWYLVEDAAFLADVSAHFGGEQSELARFLAEESKKRWGEDGALTITWEELRHKIINYENFALKHQSLPETKSVIEHELYRFVSFYLLGIDNTPAYDLYGLNVGSKQGTGKIDPELLKSYENFLKLNKDSRFYPLIRDVCNILKKHNFIWNDELENYLKSKSFY
jgi:hypothetical protein